METERLKKELIIHLKQESISNILDLWSKTKDYYDTTNITMGGGFYSEANSINVVLQNNTLEEKTRLRIRLTDIACV